LILIQYGSKILINTGKNTPIIDSNDEKRITRQTKNDEIVLHPMHGEGRGGSAISALTVSKCENFDPFISMEHESMILKTHYRSTFDICVVS